MERKEFNETLMYKYLSAYENSTGGPYAFYSIPKVVNYQLSDGSIAWLCFSIEFCSIDPTALANVSFKYTDRYSQEIKLFSENCYNKYLCDGIAKAKEWIINGIESGKITRIYQSALPDSGYDVKPGFIERKHVGFATLD